MRSEHGNSLHFISSAVYFLYNNFTTNSIFSTQTFPQKAIFRENNQKNRSPNPRVAPPRGGGSTVPTRRPSPTLLYQSLAHPPGQVTLFFNTLHSNAPPGIHRFGPLWPKMAKKRSKRGYPLF